ncbi:MAG: VanZ family protein [Pseudomonadota bacterium]
MSAILDFLAWVAIYVGRAALWTLAITGVAAPLLWALGLARAIPLAAATAFVVCLALLPLPDPAAFDCALHGKPPLLVPFAGLAEALGRTLGAGDIPGLVTDLTLVSTVMNVVFFLLPGAALALLTARPWAGLAFGLALTFGIEATQLTGLWGLYSCPHRQPDTTDLVTNTLGVALGFWLMRRWLDRRSTPRR